MVNQLEQRNILISALVMALDSNGTLAAILEDLGETGAAGRAIRNNLPLTNALEPDCRQLIRLSSKYPNGLSSLQALLRQHLQLKTTWPALEQALIAYRSTVEPNPQRVYISYAWRDGTPEGQRRGQLVDQLCEAITGAGLTFLIDREQVKPGDRISAFMKDLAKGDVILIVLSRKYLESQYCLFELLGIWNQASQDPDRFLRRVIPLTLPDGNFKTPEDLLEITQYWNQRWKGLEDRLQQDISSVHPMVFANCKDIQQFAQQLGAILMLLNDKCEPQDFDRQAQEGFQEVIKQIRAAKQW